MRPVGRIVPTTSLRHGRVRSGGRRMEGKGVFFRENFFKMV